MQVPLLHSTLQYQWNPLNSKISKGFPPPLSTSDPISYTDTNFGTIYLVLIIGVSPPPPPPPQPTHPPPNSRLNTHTHSIIASVLRPITQCSELKAGDGLRARKIRVKRALSTYYLGTLARCTTVNFWRVHKSL